VRSLVDFKGVQQTSHRRRRGHLLHCGSRRSSVVQSKPQAEANLHVFIDGKSESPDVSVPRIARAHAGRPRARILESSLPRTRPCRRSSAGAIVALAQSTHSRPKNSSPLHVAFMIRQTQPKGMRAVAEKGFVETTVGTLLCSPSLQTAWGNLQRDSRGRRGSTAKHHIENLPREINNSGCRGKLRGK
jgi:hypothetical protein